MSIQLGRQLYLKTRKKIWNQYSLKTKTGLSMWTGLAENHFILFDQILTERKLYYHLEHL